MMPVPEDSSPDPNFDRLRAMGADLAQMNPTLAQQCLYLRPLCNWSGCDPDAPATHVIMVKAHCTDAPPQLLLICEERYRRIERSSESKFNCNICDEPTPIMNAIDLCGPLKDYRP